MSGAQYPERRLFCQKLAAEASLANTYLGSNAKAQDSRREKEKSKAGPQIKEAEFLSSRSPQSTGEAKGMVSFNEKGRTSS